MSAKLCGRGSRHHYNYRNSCLSDFLRFFFKDRSSNPRPYSVEAEFSKHNLHERILKG